MASMSDPFDPDNQRLIPLVRPKEGQHMEALEQLLAITEHGTAGQAAVIVNILARGTTQTAEGLKHALDLSTQQRPASRRTGGLPTPG